MARIAVPREAMNLRMQSASVPSAVQSQPMPALVSVVLVAEDEDRPSGGMDLVAGSMRPDAVGMSSQIVCYSVGPVGPCGTQYPSIQDSAGPAGPVWVTVPIYSGLCFALDAVPSIQDSASLGMLSPSMQDYAVPVGPVGTLSPSIQDYASLGTLSPSIQDYAGPVGPNGTLSPSTQD